MKPATAPIQRPRDAKLLRIDAAGRLHHGPPSNLIDHLHRGDLLVANDAAALPASLHGKHVRSGLPLEWRLAARLTSQFATCIRRSASVPSPSVQGTIASAPKIAGHCLNCAPVMRWRSARCVRKLWVCSAIRALSTWRLTAQATRYGRAWRGTASPFSTPISNRH